MPAIRAYKHKGKIIPVDQAKLGKAYQCPWTGKIVGTKQTYVKHLRELRSSRMHRRARANRWQRLGEDLWDQTSFEKIVAWIELHPEWFLDAAQRGGFYGDRDRYDRVRSEFSIRITLLDLSWNNHLSNTHSCPHNGVRNWGREEGKPTGYPGWRGRIEYELSHELPGFGSDLMNGTRIHTGTGGSINGTNFGFSVEFFADDWPGLQKGQTWKTLQGSDMNQVRLGKPRYFR